MTYRLKFSSPSLKLRVVTLIPARLEEGTGISITKANGVYTIAVDSVALEGVVLALLENNVDILLQLINAYPLTVTTNGEITLPNLYKDIILSPGTPSARNVYLPPSGTVAMRVYDGIGNWGTNNQTFSVDGGTINGAASWVGSVDYGSFLFTPIGDGNYIAA